MKERLLSGLIAAPFTPFTADGDLDLALIAPYVEWSVKRGINGVFICGTTGESASLSMDERFAIAEEWIRHNQGRLKIVVHVGGVSQGDAIELAKHAQDCGADAIASLAPYFFKPGSASDLVHFFQPVAAAAGSLPFYYYNMPSMTGVTIPVDEFLQLAKRSIPSLAGVKYTHNNLMEMLQCVYLDEGNFEVLNGFDEILLSGLAAGATGAIGSTYNYIPAVYREILRSFEAGDIARARSFQKISVDVLNIVIKYGGGVRAGKAVMKLAGLDCGKCRPPIRPFGEPEFESLKNELEGVNFFKWSNS